MGKGKNRPFNNPFTELKGKIRFDRKPPRPTPPKRPAPRPEPVLSEEDLFLQAMSGVQRLDGQRRVVSAPPPSPPALPSEDAEAVAELADLVEGAGPFNIYDTDEYVEGSAAGVDRRLLRKLRSGTFSVQAHLDLHGMTRVEAREAVEKFMVASRREGRRCVLIVHGRGLNSKDQIPVLKEKLVRWLSRGRLGSWVLAFCTARPCDGGAGAVYVLLRRR